MKYRLLISSVFFSLFSPLAALIVGLKSNNIDYKKWSLIVFITFYGSVIFLSDQNDGFVHQSRVYQYYLDMSFAEFFEKLIGILTFQAQDGVKGDVYIHVLSFFTGTILNEPKLFFVFVSFIYAYFYASSIMLLYRYVKPVKKNKVLLFLFFFFILWKNLDGISTVRTYTALWMLFYGVSHFLIYKNWKYLIFVLCPPLVHLGFFLLCIPAWFVLSFGYILSQRIYLILYVLSFAFSFNSVKAVELIESNELAQTRRSYVMDENSQDKIDVMREEFEEKKQSMTWYRRLMKEGFQRYAFLLIIFSYFLLGMNRLAGIESKLLNIGMMNIALANYLSFITAVNARSNIVGEVFVLGFLVWFIALCIARNERSKSWTLFRKLLIFGMLIMTAFIYFQLAHVIYYLSVFLVAFPFIPWLESTTNMSIREFFGLFLPS